MAVGEDAMRNANVSPEERRSPAMAAWANECAGWLALGAADEARGIYEIGRYDEFVWARPLPGVRPRLPVMLLVEEAGEAPANESPSALRDGRLRERRERLKEAVRTFGRRGVPVYLSLPPEGDVDGWRDVARELRFRHESVQLLMGCPLPRPEAAATPGRFDVREALTDDEWEAGLDVIGDVYGDPRGMTSFYNPRDKVRLFVAWLQDEPAAVAALWPFADVAGIYSVGTKVRYRGLGLAYAVVEKVLAATLEEGFPLSTLRTTGDLLAVYMRHGFGVIGQVNRYRLDM